MRLTGSHWTIPLLITQLVLTTWVWADDVDDLRAMANGDSKDRKTLVLNPKTIENRYHWALGVSYTGAQLRYQISPKYAAEFRYQYGEADSSYGDVKAEVEGFRGYRFIPYRRNLAWYLGAEIAHANAHTPGGNRAYETQGFAAGGFAGLEYRVLPRLAIGMDIGPYFISLKEKQTQLTQTNLDFVINTALNFYLF